MNHLQNGHPPEPRCSDYDDEIADFNARNKGLIDSLKASYVPAVTEIMDELSRQNRSDPTENLWWADTTLQLLSFSVFRQAEALIQLVSHGFGYSAMRLLRSLFECYIDILYIARFPDEVSELIEFYSLNITLEEFYMEKPRDYGRLQSVIAEYAKFYTPIPKKNRKKKRVQWSSRSAREKAKLVGLGDDVFAKNYNLPHFLIHTSPVEFLNYLQELAAIGEGKAWGTGEVIGAEAKADEREIADFVFIECTKTVSELLMFLGMTYDLPGSVNQLTLHAAFLPFKLSEKWGYHRPAY